MVKPEVGIFATNVYDQLLPALWADEQHDWQGLTFVNAIGQMFDVSEILARDTVLGPGWSIVVDVDRCPNYALDWLAQLLGIVLPQGLSEQQRRDRIKSTDGFKRGSVGAMKNAAKPWLTGNKVVILRERDTSAYHFRVITYYNETPGEDLPVNNVIANPSFETNTSGWYAHG